MKLSISNIAWEKEQDEEMYRYISNSRLNGIEIAPTRIIEEKPYVQKEKAIQFKKLMNEKYQLEITSMQSIWYGRKEKIFSNKKERETLIEYTKQAIDFAKTLGCKNLVFGCPKNRVINKRESDYKIALEFFKEIGDYANENQTCFSIEPNPEIYNTNFITTTKEALEIVKKLNNTGIKVNVDLGTIIQNREDISIFKNNINLINHVHISEPNLECIKERKLHNELINLLKEENYQGYISIEMKKQDNISKVKGVIEYLINITEEI